MMFKHFFIILGHMDVGSPLGTPHITGIASLAQVEQFHDRKHEELLHAMVPSWFTPTT